MKQNDTTTWEELKDDVYGKIGTERRDRIERDFKSLRVGLLLRLKTLYDIVEKGLGGKIRIQIEL